MRKIKVVKKIWGREEWIVNKSYCGKFLIFKRGYRSSLHYHKKKPESFYLLEGKILLEYGSKRKQKKKILKKGDVHHVKTGKVHRFNALENSKIIEFSLHHKDSDSHRLEFGGKIPKKR